MSAANETIADIVAGMRYGTIPKHRTDHELLALYADRIEAAAKLEHGNLDALERACEGVLDAETLKAVVAAKVRMQKGSEE